MLTKRCRHTLRHRLQHREIAAMQEQVAVRHDKICLQLVRITKAQEKQLGGPRGGREAN